MAVSTLFLFPLASTLFGGLLLGFPVGIPPRPPDPMMEAIAPPDCLWYASSAGYATPDPTNTNHVERLLAEPEVRSFCRGVEDIVQASLRRQSRGLTGRVLTTELPKLVKAALLLPQATYVSRISISEPGDHVEVRAGMVVNLGDQSDEITRALVNLERLAFEGAPAPTVERDGVRWHELRLPPPFPKIGWCEQDQYLLIAVGDGEADALMKRMKARNAAPPWLANAKRELRVERLATVGYVNVAAAVELIKPQLGPAQTALGLLGVDNVTSIATISGLDPTVCVCRTHIAIDGAPRGVMALLPHQGLSTADLEVVPPNTTFAMAARLDLETALLRVLEMIDQFDPAVREEVEKQVWHVDAFLGVDVRRELIGTLGDVWRVYIPRGDVLTSWIGTTLVADVKDAAQLRSAAGKLAELASRDRSAGRRDGVRIRSTRAGKDLIYVLSVADDEFPIAPAWCVTDDYLVVGLMPQTIRQFLSRKKKRGTSLVSDLQHAGWTDEPGPSYVAYADTQRIVRGLYPLLQLAARTVCGGLQKNGIDVDVSLLPSIDAIAPHLVPGMTRMARTETGFLLESRQSVPGGSVASTLPLAAILTLPALTSARQAAHQTKEMNQLKQLALAVHLYHNTHGHVPSNVRDDNGKALLSWRVQLLPYVDQAALYDEFHLDERWDSAHNKALIDRMPDVLRTPGASAGMGRTQYVTLGTDQSLLGASEKIRFRDITDGMSNTLLVARVAPRAAVTWTAPRDIRLEDADLATVLKSNKNYFLAAMADGSVRRFRISVDPAKLRAMVTYKGGEVIDWLEEVVP